MKDKILYLILGILIGAVITAGCFLVFSKNGKGEMEKGGPRNEIGNMIKGERLRDGETPPEMPNSATSTNSI